jgi:hypothetical protein
MQEYGWNVVCVCWFVCDNISLASCGIICLQMFLFNLTCVIPGAVV